MVIKIHDFEASFEMHNATHIFLKSSFTRSMVSFTERKKFILTNVSNNLVLLTVKKKIFQVFPLFMNDKKYFPK